MPLFFLELTIFLLVTIQMQGELLLGRFANFYCIFLLTIAFIPFLFVSLPLEHRLIVLMGQESCQSSTIFMASAEARRCDFSGLNNTALMLLVISGNLGNFTDYTTR